MKDEPRTVLGATSIWAPTSAVGPRELLPGVYRPEAQSGEIETGAPEGAAELGLAQPCAVGPRLGATCFAASELLSIVEFVRGWSGGRGDADREDTYR